MKSTLHIQTAGETLHTVPVTTVDDAKAKLDAYNKDYAFPCQGHIIFESDDGVVRLWQDDEFNLSELNQYFDTLEENGGYDTHEEFTEDSGAFHEKMDELFAEIE